MRACQSRQEGRALAEHHAGAGAGFARVVHSLLMTRRRLAVLLEIKRALVSRNQLRLSRVGGDSESTGPYGFGRSTASGR